MYNGVGLQTARGTGTNGYVQRNLADIKVSKGKPNYRSEADIKHMEAILNRPPNLEILDHARKRQIELKCFELRELMEEQDYTEEEIDAKVNEYRQLLMKQKEKAEAAGQPTSTATDSYGRPVAQETHQVAELQQDKNARLRDAFGISDEYVDGSAMDKSKPAKSVVENQPKKKSDEKPQRESGDKKRPLRSPSSSPPPVLRHDLSPPGSTPRDQRPSRRSPSASSNARSPSPSPARGGKSTSLKRRHSRDRRDKRRLSPPTAKTPECRPKRPASPLKRTATSPEKEKRKSRDKNRSPSPQRKCRDSNADVSKRRRSAAVRSSPSPPKVRETKKRRRDRSPPSPPPPPPSKKSLKENKKTKRRRRDASSSSSSSSSSSTTTSGSTSSDEVSSDTESSSASDASTGSSSSEASSDSSRASIPRRRGSPSFKERRRITRPSPDARKRKSPPPKKERPGKTKDRGGVVEKRHSRR